MDLDVIIEPNTTGMAMKGYGVGLYGYWGTALDSSHMTRDGGEDEFNPITRYFDPNIAQYTESALEAHLAGWNASGVRPFWFSRPCSTLVDSFQMPNGSWEWLPVNVTYPDPNPDRAFSVPRKGSFFYVHDMVESFP